MLRCLPLRVSCFCIVVYCFSILGGELFDRVICDEYVLTEKACACVMRQVCDGVSYMHRNRIIHLDMKVLYESSSSVHECTVYVTVARCMWHEMCRFKRMF